MIGEPSRVPLLARPRVMDLDQHDLDQHPAVVGVDASDDSRRALAWAMTALPATTRIVAVHAWDIPSMVELDTSATMPPEQYPAFAERAVRELVDEIDDGRVEACARQGLAGRVLVAAADEFDAGVVVVGHLGRGRSSLLLGSTTNHLLQHTERPLVVVRGSADDVPRRVVVAVDDRPPDDDGGAPVRAVRWPLELAGVERLDVVHAARRRDADDERLTEVARDLIGAAGPLPLDVAVSIEEGSAADVLVGRSRSADLIVMGSRGRGGVAGLLLGSTSRDVVSRSECPVAIIR